MITEVSVGRDVGDSLRSGPDDLMGREGRSPPAVVVGAVGSGRMKTGRSWSIRDIDARTREIAEAAARRAGVTPEAWLADAIARTAGDQHAAGDDGGDIAATLAALGEQVRAMTDDVRAAEAPELDLDAMVERLAREIQDPDETARTTVEGLGRHPGPQRAAAGLEEVLRSLEAQVAAVARRGREEPRPEPPRGAGDRGTMTTSAAAWRRCSPARRSQLARRRHRPGTPTSTR